MFYMVYIPNISTILASNMITLSLLFILLLPCSHSLSFFTNLTNTTVSIYLPAEFSVFIKHSSPIILSWRHNTNYFTCATANTTCYPIVAGYSLTMATSGDLTLFSMKIESVDISHTGNVSCEAIRLSDNKVITSRATLVVRDVLDFLNTPGNRALLVGDSTNFICLGNKGGGSYAWKRNGTSLPSNPRYKITSPPPYFSLNISDLTAVDIGQFICEYTLGGDVITSHPAVLILIDYRAPTVIQTSIGEVNTLVGPKSVSCPFDGYPLPTLITWQHNGIPIPSTPSQGPYTNGGVLYFDLASESDSGDYTCTASNGRDSASGTVSVNVTGFLGILQRWYVIMGICVAGLAIMCVSVALILSVVCCCWDRRRERELEGKYEERIKEIKSRRRERAEAARMRAERAQKPKIDGLRKPTRPASLPPTRPNPIPQTSRPPGNRDTQFTSKVRNPDGSVAYTVVGERIKIKESRPRTLTTVEEVSQMKERPPTHLRLPKKAK